MRGQVKVYQKKIVAKRRRRVFLLSLYSFIALAIVVSGLSFVSQLNSLSIEKIVTEGATRVAEADLRSVVLEKISGNYGYLFSKRNTFLFPKDDIEETLAELPAVKRVDVSRRGLNALVVFVTEREEAARWCSNADGSSCFLIDEAGMVFAPSHVSCGAGVCLSSMATSSSFVYKGLISENPLGKNFLPPDEFKKMEFFMQEVERLSLKPVEAEILENGYMTITLFDGGKIIVSTKDDLAKVLANLETIVLDTKIAPNFAKFLAELDYIKIDSGNKVVYKMKSSTTGEI